MTQTAILTADGNWHIINENMADVVTKIWKYQQCGDTFIPFHLAQNKEKYINCINIISVEEVKE